jgi:hypothetical protein
MESEYYIEDQYKLSERLKNEGVEEADILFGDISVIEMYPRILKVKPSVKLDKDNYIIDYATVDKIVDGITVSELPPSYDFRVQQCFKYDLDNDSWILDEDKFLELYKTWHKNH